MVGLMEILAMSLVVLSCTTALAQVGFLFYLFKNRNK